MEGVVARRVIPSDNSCLFNAVGYVMDHDKNKAPELRQVIAATVHLGLPKFILLDKQSGIHNYNLEVYHKLSFAFGAGLVGNLLIYCADFYLIFCGEGAIELSILADYYGREIAAYDIQTTRCDLYGQGKKYSERVMLIYDGLHYDALAMSPFDGAPEEFDQTIFHVRSDRTIGPIEGLALNLVKEQHRKRSFTDTARFTLRCGVCQIGVVGQKILIVLLREFPGRCTGHVNFQEYR
ncbi:hypothetical protein EZV62_009052 [Acer yangbiense]|uniref:Ubiquitin thioesterase OTU n=1 Tax=Acer yangbiense TaxID=1000413 RepID=A0A5C7IEK9_9ROSI|nr:hypothetical protein EZV62_009052 [Acer yangbiense]